MIDKSEILRIAECNRLAWDASAVHHNENPEWQKLKAGFARAEFSTFDATLTAILTDLPVLGQSVVQIGCNNGRELLSAMALGAKSGLGIDQSTAFIDQAYRLTEISGRDCQFLASNIYSLPEDTPRGFDVALITIGVLNWMPDIDLFFKVVSSLLSENGKLVIYETHPFLEVFDPGAADPFLPASSYFVETPFVSEQAIVYDESEPSRVPASYWYVHRLGDIITACIDAGLCLDKIVEYPHSNRETEYDLYTNQVAQLPMCFSLVAHKG